MKEVLGRKKFYRLDGILLLLLCISTGIAIYYYYNVNVAKTSEYTLEYNYFSTLDAQDSQYIVSNSKSDLMKVNKNGEIEFLKSSRDKIEGTFYEANEIAVDKQGRLYVHDVVWNEDGLTISRESIRLYDKDGTYINTVYELVNESMEKRHRLFGLSACSDGIYFVTSENNKMKLQRAVPDGTCQMVKEIPYSGTGAIQDISLSDSGKLLYYLTKDCQIYEYNIQDNGTTLIYETPDKEYIVPFFLESGEGNKVYFSDIANGDIYCVDKGEAYVLLSCEEMSQWTGQQLDKEVLNRISATVIGQKEEITVAFDFCIINVDLESREYDIITECSYSSAIKISSTIWIVNAAFMIIVLLWLVVRIGAVVIRGGYLNKQTITLTMVVSITVTSLAVIPYMLTLFSNIYIDAQVSQMCLVAQIAADTMDTAALEQVVYPSDYGNENYQSLRSSMEKIVDSSHDWSQGMYLNVAKHMNNRYYSVAYLDNSIGGYYPIGAYEAQEIDYVYDNKQVYINNGMADSTGEYIYIKYPVVNSNKEVIGVIEVGMVLNTLQEQIAQIYQKLTVAILLVVITAIFLFNELLQFRDSRKEFIKERKEVGKKRASLYDSSVPFSKELAGSLPLTMNFAVMGVVALICSKILRRFSFRNVLMGGAFISLLGDISMAFANNYWIGFMAMFFNGLGVGIIIASLYICVAEIKNEEEQRKCFANLNGAELSGLISGMVIGAIIAESFGQRYMFYISSGVWVVLLGLFFALGKSINLDKKSLNMKANTVEKQPHRRSLRSFIFSKQIMGFILLLQIPYAIVNGFTYYFVPIFGDVHGLGEDITSLILVLNSLTGVFFSVALTNLFVKKLKRVSMYLASAISLSALLLFAVFPNLPMLITAVFLIGFARSFGTTSRNGYYCDLKEVGEYGEDKAIGIYNFMENIGDSVGTSYFGYIYGAGMNVGLLVLTAGSAAAIGIYEAVCARGKKER